MIIYFVRMLWYNELELYILVSEIDIMVMARAAQMTDMTGPPICPGHVLNNYRAKIFGPRPGHVLFGPTPRSGRT